MIIRGPRPSDNFAQIHNDALSDSRLSFKARGLLAYLLSRPTGWRTSAERIAVDGPDGRDAIRAALRELEAVGYVVRTRGRDDSGHWTHQQVVTDQPGSVAASLQVEDIRAGHTEDGLSVVGLSGVGLSAVGKPADSSKKEMNKKEGSKKEVTPARGAGARAGLPGLSVDGDDGFDRFWSVYPRKAGKQAARKAWAKARRSVSVDVLVEAAQRYRDDPNREAAFTAHPSTWLNQGRWEDEPLPERPAGGGHADRVRSVLQRERSWAMAADAAEGQARQIGDGR